MNPQFQPAIAGAVTIHGGQPTTTSLDIAALFGKRHTHVLRDIQALIEPKSGLNGAVTEPISGLSETAIAKFCRLNFEESGYTDPTGRPLPMYHLTKDGFVLLVMGYTGEKAMLFKIAYIAEFNRMREELNSIKADALRRAHAQLEARNTDWTLIRREYLSASGTGREIEARHSFGRGKVSRNVRRMIAWGYMNERDVAMYQRLHREFSVALKSVRAEQLKLKL